MFCRAEAMSPFAGRTNRTRPISAYPCVWESAWFGRQRGGLFPVMRLDCIQRFKNGMVVDNVIRPCLRDGLNTLHNAPSALVISGLQVGVCEVHHGVQCIT